ncbi:MAG: M6 family metalloprotease domain-containing protein [Magnetococcales bacterium]|nr:M6 family metalloprotease domain-containing protein [Magnetococcales bacterium]MBF0149720.1 M6 family metalloprotease domain-containing protein [Magnetococcales bacterium]MBF0174539.1 M6 family metalloprotease domain-containing protein [Magnetococcales bacterium]MBF0632810.1 M6 family metalloprotease domain-containing protein [Magnetococcales bacterium]
MSVPFFNKEFTFTQPDGSQIKVFGWGDQHGAVFKTQDGKLVARNEQTGFYEAGTLDENGVIMATGHSLASTPAPGALESVTTSRELATVIKANPGLPRGNHRWQERAKEKKMMLDAIEKMGTAIGPLTAPPPNTTTGSYVGLCILIEFPDVAHTISKADVENFLNKAGYTGNGNAGSVYDYFKQVSDNKLEYKGKVTAYYKAKHNRSYYTDETITYPNRALELINEALNHLKSSGFDFSSISMDSAGYIYATNVYYVGDTVNNWGKGLWPHAYHMASPVTVGSGRKVYDYQITNMGSGLTLATYCHENGHMLCDFPDLYDYYGTGNDSAGVGHYCLMGYGGPNPKRPVKVGAYLRYRAGWVTSLTQLTPGMGNVTIPAGHGCAIFKKRASKEYFILENRQKQGWDTDLTDSGLAIWHVDEAGSNNFEQGLPNKHYECALEQADNKMDLENNRNLGDANDLYPFGRNNAFNKTSKPSSRWWNGISSGLNIINIVNTGGGITFKVV